MLLARRRSLLFDLAAPLCSVTGIHLRTAATRAPIRTTTTATTSKSTSSSLSVGPRSRGSPTASRPTLSAHADQDARLPLQHYAAGFATSMMMMMRTPWHRLYSTEANAPLPFQAPRLIDSTQFHEYLSTSPAFDTSLPASATEKDADQEAAEQTAQRRWLETKTRAETDAALLNFKQSATYTKGVSQLRLDSRDLEQIPRSHPTWPAGAPPPRVAVGVSGGVDSTVAAYLLKRQGLDVIGVYMKNWDELDETGHCTGEQDMRDAALSCAALGIPFRTVNFVKEYWNDVFTVFLQEYQRGRTPNPDILCNREIKFKALLNVVQTSFGAQFLATGHYAGVNRSAFASGLSPHPQLIEAHDKAKDQTYFLAAISSEALSRTLFPLYGLEKHQVKRIAHEIGLIELSTKKESVGICFVGKRRFDRFISNYIAPQPGYIELTDGTIVGQHQGHFLYTVGQHRGLPGGADQFCVVAKDSARNAVIVTKASAISRAYKIFGDTVNKSGTTAVPAKLVDASNLAEPDPSCMYSRSIVVSAPSWIAGVPPLELQGGQGQQLRCGARFRHRAPIVPCTVTLQSDESGQASPVKLHIQLDRPFAAVAPGQFAALYLDGVCLGGGDIVETDVLQMLMAQQAERELHPKREIGSGKRRFP
ncbi:tRNA methyl transferase [Capsaspora owczarzaki ATCC 30864]|uniref:tRNA-5-taurinomethyluridine 2-sulfurtransferase n=1 Tax=Capsaspora owczarzaki (strain ATCC 30864) TaxID=595528 RepID=A0A0D2VNP6_CAPO3|nr:tRNA methyl transferase [Capsaspora owczarzaki ATCC 30864]KJE91972.1 tRNA methyl transferase [Capsaspora owczarzaki ATCC 30864]|eukprot:XP_004363854.1 tRNA methyl transferase [Capsaspora owczarzaki ATCC 30864]